MIISDTDPANMTEAEKQEERKQLLSRLKQLNTYPRSDWHREFEDALQIDVASWDNGSWVIREHSLGEEAPRTDFIVVSGNRLPADAKDVFKIFRRNNVIEFKGPGGKLTILTLRKVAGYVNFYIATAKKEEGVTQDNVTATIFASEKNDKEFADMMSDGIIVPTGTPGIYEVKTLTDIPFQVIMIGELAGDGYATYRILKKHADIKDVDLLLESIKNEKSQALRDRLHRLLDLAESKNPGTVADKIREDKDLKSIFMQVLKPEIDEEINGAVNTAVDNTTRTNLYIYVQKGIMSVDNAATEAGIPVADFEKEMADNGYKVPQSTPQPA